MFVLKPRFKEIRHTLFQKYYEPYIVISGKYAIDYCKKVNYNLNVEQNVQEIALLDKKFKPEKSKQLPHEPDKVINLEGVAYFHYEDTTTLILNNIGLEIDSRKLPQAPFEDYTKEELVKSGIKFVDVKINTEQEINILRSKIAKKPPDVGEIIREIFEINERAVIYCPIYHFELINTETRKGAIIRINSVTGEITSSNFTNHFIKDLIDFDNEDLIISEELNNNISEELTIKVKKKSNKVLEETSRNSGISQIPQESQQFSKMPEADETIKKEDIIPFPAKLEGEAFTVGDNVTAIVGDLEIPSGTVVTEALVVKGNLKIGQDCQLLGNVKALKDIIIGSNTTIAGNVVSGSRVVVGPDSTIQGSLESSGDVEIYQNAIIEGGLRSGSTVTLDKFAKVMFAMNAAKGVIVV